MNRILRPGGYFILSSKHSSIEVEEGLSSVYVKGKWLLFFFSLMKFLRRYAFTCFSLLTKYLPE